MKTVWTGVDERGEIVWNAIFLDFARYWGFTPRLCRLYRAQTKGKVESGVKYVRRNSSVDCWDARRRWPMGTTWTIMRMTWRRLQHTSA